MLGNRRLMMPSKITRFDARSLDGSGDRWIEIRGQLDVAKLKRLIAVVTRKQSAPFRLRFDKEGTLLADDAGFRVFQELLKSAMRA